MVWRGDWIYSILNRSVYVCDVCVCVCFLIFMYTTRIIHTPEFSVTRYHIIIIV